MSTGFVSRLQKGAVLCDGAMGTLLYAKGIFINRCYDELNLSAPDLIRGIHQDYLKAGAEVIETNTFGANSFRLSKHGCVDKLVEINRQGVRLAREAAKNFDALCRRGGRTTRRAHRAAGQDFALPRHATPFASRLPR